jgi:hypothetical protein
MKISVVVATYNGEKFIEKQLDSILSQSCIPDEIIIADDASGDKTPEILKEYENKYKNIVLLENKFNIGYVRNFKRAIEASAGDIIFLSDQDDVWEKEKIETIKRLFERYDKIKAVSSSYNLIDKDDILINRKKGNCKIRNINRDEFIKHPKYPGMAMAFRKSLWNEIVENNYLDWDILSAHDWGINYVAARQGAMVYFESALVRYRQHDNNFSGMMKKQKSSVLRDKREKLIKELIGNLSSVITADREEADNLLKATCFQKKRLFLYQKNSLINLLFFEIANRRFISVKSVIGDIYSLIQGRNKKNG